jgi:hypothetical protein
VLRIPVRLYGRQAKELTQAESLTPGHSRVKLLRETKSRRIPNYIDVNVIESLEAIVGRGNRTNLAYSHLLGAGTYLTNLFKTQNLHLAHWDKVCTEIKQILSPAPAYPSQFSCPSEETSQAVPRHESVSRKAEQPGLCTRLQKSELTLRALLLMSGDGLLFPGIKREFLS